MSRTASYLAVTDTQNQATNEDGFHSNGNDVGPTIVDSLIEFTGDDTGNICSAMSVVLDLDTPNLVTMVDTANNLRRGRAGDTVSFYHLNTQKLLGSVTLDGAPTESHDQALVKKMRGGFATMQAPPYSAGFVANVKRSFANGLPVPSPSQHIATMTRSVEIIVPTGLTWIPHIFSSWPTPIN